MSAPPRHVSYMETNISQRRKEKLKWSSRLPAQRGPRQAGSDSQDAQVPRFKPGRVNFRMSIFRKLRVNPVSPCRVLILLVGICRISYRCSWATVLAPRRVVGAYTVMPPLQLMTTLAPSLPNTPRSLGLGLLFLPFLPFKKPNMPPEPSFLASGALLASLGRVASWRASSDQLPPPSSVTCTPPVGLVTRLLIGGDRGAYWGCPG